MAIFIAGLHGTAMLKTQCLNALNACNDDHDIGFQSGAVARSNVFLSFKIRSSLNIVKYGKAFLLLSENQKSRFCCVYGRSRKIVRFVIKAPLQPNERVSQLQSCRLYSRIPTLLSVKKHFAKTLRQYRHGQYLKINFADLQYRPAAT